MRDIRKGNCPLCDHHQIVAAYQPEWGDTNTEHPSAVTAEPRLLFSGRSPSTTYGHLRTYFCRSCGFAQEFVESPESVPIAAEYHTELIEGSKRDGYR